MIRGFSILAVLAGTLVAVPAFGQGLQVSVAVGGSTQNVAAGSSVAVTSSGLGQAVPVSVTVRTTTATTLSGFTLTGTSEMGIVSAPTLPLALTAGSSATFTVLYVPSSGNAVNGQVSIAFIDNNQTSSFQFVLVGTAPNLAFSYFFVPNGALTDLRTGDRVTFPPTNLGASATATFTVLNRGTATGSLQSVTVSGSSYQLVGSAGTPAQLQPGQQTSFNVVFAPAVAGSSQGLLSLTLNNGIVTFALAGTGAEPNFTAAYTLADGNAHPLTDGTAISFPSTDINGTSTATIGILNQGTGSGQVTGITLSGNGFRLNGIGLLPATVGPGQALVFGIVFAPTQAGTFTGAFRLDVAGKSISGTLTASTNTPNLIVSYTLADGNVRPLADGTNISFPGIDNNATSTATINILNQGTGAGTVTAIALTGTGFTLAGLPLLPATVAPGQSLRFNIVFSPKQTGSFTGTFRFDLAGISLSGTLTASTNTPNLTVSYTLADGNVRPLADGTNITFPGIDNNATSTAAINIFNQGTGAGTVSAIALTGTGFTLAGLPLLPATVAPGQSLRFNIVFSPKQTGSFTGTFRFDLAGISISGTLTAATNSPNLTISYTLADGNVRPLIDGTNITFPGIDNNATTIAAINIVNQGTGAGAVTAIVLTGTGFTLSGLPLLPATIAPGQSLRFNIGFAPKQTGSFTGAFRLDLAGVSVSGTLTGSTNTPNLTASYLLADGNVHPLADGTNITFPGIDSTATSTAIVSISNQGTGSGSVTAIGLAGTGFTLAGLPLFPVTIAPGQALLFGIVFTPKQAGSFTGTFSIDLAGKSISGTLTAFTNTPTLAVSYTLADGNIRPLPDGSNITFPAIDSNATSTATINVLNQSTSTGSVTAISVSGAGFTLTGLPLLPAALAQGQAMRFGIVFTPTQAGNFTGTFRIDLAGRSISGTLTASANTPNLAVSYALADGSVRSLADGVFINFPSADVNATSTATINIVNQSTGTGTLTGITLAGNGFRLSGVPTLPATIAPGQAIHFSVIFAPSQSGAFAGSLRLDLTGRSISASLAGSTTLPNFTVVYNFADKIVQPFPDGTTITFPSVDVNATGMATIGILNQGAGVGTVTAVSVTGNGFRLAGLPLLPATVPAGQTLSVGIIFAPTQAGSFTGSFRIDLTGRSIFGTLAGSTALPSFTVVYSLADNIARPLPDGTAITFPPIDLHATTTASISILNQGAGAGTLNGISVVGNGFRLTGLPLFPFTVPAGQALVLGVVFAPTQAGNFTGSLRIDMASRSVSASLAGSTAPSNISLAYVDPTTNSIIPLQNGSTILFPEVTPGAASEITFSATNAGTGTGFIDSVTLGGASPSIFQLLSLPTFPAAVPPSQVGRFGIRFSPQLQQVFSATLLLTVNGQAMTINLSGKGIGPQYTYAYSDRTNTTALLPGGTAVMADTAVGQISNLTISILNTGAGNGQIAAVSVTGQGLSLAELPAIPLTLRPNVSQSFTLSFSPTQPGAVSGRLTVGSDTFTITATGIGSRLIYSYLNAAATTPVTDGGVVIFTPTAVGSNSNVQFSVQNTGTSAATISSINLAASSTVFVLENMPGLPLNLEPGATTAFLVAFAPNNTGGLTSTLRINTSSFTMSGTGSQPMALPAYQFQGPSGNLQPAQQPAFGLTLSSSYPLSVQGTLTLTFVPSVFTDDPAIQFASGGRTVKFSIPANSTQALFNGTATSIPLQSGTTAGNIVITPTFTLQGGFDVTPSSPATLSLTIPSAAPQLLSADITSQTLTTFTVILNGYSTTRSIRQLDVQITPKQGETFSTTNLTFDVRTASSNWFQSSASQGFGGGFSIAIPFVLQNGSTSDDLVHRLQSLSITATNDVGTSSAISIPIR